MNISSLTGNITKDCEIQEFGDSKYVVFTVAENLFNGVDKDPHTNYIDVKYKINNASFFKDTLTKGKKVTVIGEFRIKKNVKDDKTYYNHMINARDVDLPEKEKKTVNTETQQQESNQSSNNDLDDEIPF